MESVNLSFHITPIDHSAGLGLEVWVNGNQIYNIDSILREIDVNVNFEVEDGQHQLEVVMKNKKATHTEIDEQGNITRDALLKLTDFSFDGINIDKVVWAKSRYHHDFNGTQAPVEDSFIDTMGCNGRVVMDFETPIYLWLLENV